MTPPNLFIGSGQPEDAERSGKGGDPGSSASIGSLGEFGHGGCYDERTPDWEHATNLNERLKRQEKITKWLYLALAVVMAAAIYLALTRHV